MDLNKIFIKGACPTSIGGQAVMEGIMMRGPKRTAIAVRLPDGRIHIKTSPTKQLGAWGKIPLVRGVASFISSLVTGVNTLMYSADVLTDADPEDYEPDKFDAWIENKVGKEKAMKYIVALSVVIAVGMSVGLFMLLPTAIVGLFSKVTENVIVLNLIEGLVRMILFLLYIWLISLEKDIARVYQYHGAEHKTIHCFENNLPLTPDNAQQFYTLHPRCGTSFMMFTMIISILLHVFMGWPALWLRLLTRILLLPAIAGLSYELLKWAGRSNNPVVEFLSLPGIYLQKLTTKTPDNSQLEVAIAAVKAVLRDGEDVPYIEGICDLEGNLIMDEETYKAELNAKKAVKNSQNKPSDTLDTSSSGKDAENKDDK